MRKVWLVVALVACLCGYERVEAQVPSAEQLELLRTMSPEDRQALLEQLGLGNIMGEGGAASAAADANRGARSPSTRSGSSPKTRCCSKSTSPRKRRPA